MGNLTTLAQMKLMLQIPTLTTTYDALLTVLIASASSRIETYLNRRLGLEEYVENMAPSFDQVLQMPQWPIRAVASIESQGDALVVDEDYYLYTQYTRSGQIYRGQTWSGPTYIRGLTGDPYAGVIILEVTYTAGYDLPDSGDDEFPLPADLTLVCQMMVSSIYRNILKQNLGGDLSSYQEGGISMSWDKVGERASSLFGINNGMETQFASILNPYKKWAVA